MKKILLLVALFMPACASATPQEDPLRRSATPLVADSGASLYVFETWDDWLDDGGHKIIQRTPDEVDEPPIGPKASSHTQWIGEVALGLVLRWVFRQPSDRVRFIGHADFEPVTNVTSEVTIFDPVAEAARLSHEARVGFRVKLHASQARDPKYFSIRWEAEYLVDGPGIEGPDGSRGSPPREIERIAGGACWLPPRASLLMLHRKDGNRATFLILRLTSVRTR